MEQITNFLQSGNRVDSLIGMATNVVIAILILIIGLWIAKKVSKTIIKISKKYPHLDETLFRFLASIAKFLILAIVGMAVLGRFGVETTSIVAVLGAATVAIGLALQGSLSNLAAGVMLLIFRPFKVGDFVDGGGSFGNIEEINLFTTNMQTFDNQQIIIPNSKIWGEKIINHSHQSDPAPFIEVESLSERSVEILVRPFTDGAHYFDVTYSVPEQIKAALGRAGFATPYPQTRIVMQK